MRCWELECGLHASGQYAYNIGDILVPGFLEITSAGLFCSQASGTSQIIYLVLQASSPSPPFKLATTQNPVHHECPSFRLT